MFHSRPRKTFSVNTLPRAMAKAWCGGHMATKLGSQCQVRPARCPGECNQEEVCLGYPLRANRHLLVLNALSCSPVNTH